MKQNMFSPNYVSAVFGFLNLIIICNDDLCERIIARADLASKLCFSN